MPMHSCQCSPAPCQCVPYPPPGLPLHIPLVWVVRAFMLASMQLQVFLVIFGARRYRSSSPFRRFIVWGAYLAADAVAISALGIMTHSIRNRIYGLWAPILLLHLGGPDTITAYSTADNELWKRHGFIMIYQVLVAAYVVYISRLEVYLLASAVLLFIVGATKYAERTLALRSASNTEMVISTNALYKFMQFEGTHDPEDYNYVVLGEQSLHDMVIPKGDDRHGWESLLNNNAIVTIKKVFEQEGRQVTDNYTLSLSHALFKMYKRRFVGLYFHEAALPKTRRFFINERQNYEDVFNILQIELKFMYDVLFSKSSSTAFRKKGIVLRLLNICLLTVAAYLVFFQLTKIPAHKTVTFVIISVALAIEILQLCRIALSDWTMVRLICARIQQRNQPRRCCWCTVQMIQFAMNLVGIARKRIGNKYWKDKLNQYCLMGSHGKCYRRMWKLGNVRWMRRSLVLLCCRKKDINTSNGLRSVKSFIFEIVKDKCSPEQDIQICRDRVYDPDEYLTTKCPELLNWSRIQLEDAILVWHIATSICEDSDQNAENRPHNFGVASTLSRYFAYLLVEHPNILPLHADIAELTYIEFLDLIIDKAQDASKWTNKIDNVKSIANGKENVARSGSLADELMKRHDRWDIIAHYWGELLICVAAYNKAPLHAECIAAGGEFLTQLWALLGHLGCGEQSDTAVTKRNETKQMDQDYLAKKRKEEDQTKTRADEENKRRIAEMRNRTLHEINMEMSEGYHIKTKEEEEKGKVEGRLKSIIEDR